MTPGCRSLAAALAFLAGSFQPAAGQLPRARPETVGMSADQLQRIPAALRGFVQRREIAGAVTLVARHGRIVALDSAGFRDLASRGPMRSNTIFRIASMTKPVTSVAAMILVEQGGLGLDDPVSRFIPEFARVRVSAGGRDPAGRPDSLVPAVRPITVRDLLTHRSGLVYGYMDTSEVGDAYRAAGVLDGVGGNGVTTMAENVRRLAAQPLAFHPGREWRYGLSTDLLGRVVEVASGMPLDRFFAERIFVPLGMHDTGFRVPDDKLDRLVTTYTRRNDSLLPLADTLVFSEGRLPLGRFGGPGNRGSETFFSGGSGLFSTIGDYARFAQMLLNGGELEGARILSPDTIELMTRDATADLRDPIGTPGYGFGLGFAVLHDPDAAGEPASEGRFGWSGILGTRFWIDPREQLIGVMLIQGFPPARGLAETFQNLVYRAITTAGGR